MIQRLLTLYSQKIIYIIFAEDYLHYIRRRLFTLLNQKEIYILFGPNTIICVDIYYIYKEYKDRCIYYNWEMENRE